MLEWPRILESLKMSAPEARKRPANVCCRVAKVPAHPSLGSGRVPRPPSRSGSSRERLIAFWASSSQLGTTDLQQSGVEIRDREFGPVLMTSASEAAE